MNFDFSELLVFLIAVREDSIRDILLKAYDLKMNNGEYAFVGIQLVKANTKFSELPWFVSGDPRSRDARIIFESYMEVNVRVPTSPQYTMFADQVVKYAKKNLSSLANEGDVRIIII